jgi:hypothetical protein
MQRLNLSVLVLKLWPKIIKHGLWIIPIVEILMSPQRGTTLEDELVKVGFTLINKKAFYIKAL